MPKKWYNFCRSVCEMGTNLILEQIQAQKLVLTPELVQSIKILQKTSLELQQYIDSELLSNPLLELAEEQPDNYAEEQDLRFDWTEHAKDRSYDDFSSRRITASESDDYNYEQFVRARYSLFDYLHNQLAVTPGVNKDICMIANYIIDSLNPWGYRTERATEIADKLGYSHDTVMKAVQLVQSLEPAGIAAKSIEECLILQLKRSGEYNEIFDEIINHHLDDLAANKISVIAKSVGLPVDETAEYCDEIRHLDPKPGIRFGDNYDNSYITPDVYVRELEGKYIVQANEKLTPLLSTSPYYERMLTQAAGDKDTLEYLKTKMDSAIWLIKGIDQRRQTIQKIAEAIVEKQSDFFRIGTEGLKPMTLSDVAEKVNVHESTVSRAVNGKYMQTPRGLFEMKYFFKGGISSAGGEDMAQEAIKKCIRSYIDNENPKKPLSDEKIRDMLEKDKGIKIARRTIAKYREALGISATSKRKKY